MYSGCIYQKCYQLFNSNFNSLTEIIYFQVPQMILTKIRILNPKIMHQGHHHQLKKKEMKEVGLNGKEQESWSGV